MSAITDSTTTAAPFDDETPTVHVTRTFKTTDENKSTGGTVYLNAEFQEELIQTSLRSARWRSFGQMMNDALIYYLDGEGGEKSARTVVDEAEWNSDHHLSFAITPTLQKEIEMMVNHSHTPWTTKQEFYICSLFFFVEAGMPVMERR